MVPDRLLLRRGYAMKHVCEEHELPAVYCERCVYNAVGKARELAANGPQACAVREYAATIRALQHRLEWPVLGHEHKESCVQPDRWRKP